MHLGLICVNTQVFISSLCEMERSAEELLAIERIADEAVVAAAAPGGRHGVAQRWATSWRGGWLVAS